MLVPTAILAVILVLGVVVLGPSEERLSQPFAEQDRRTYDRLFTRVKLVTGLLAILVVIATYMMVAHVPD